MFRDGVGRGDPKKINGAERIMCYTITSPKDIDPYHPNYKWEHLKTMR